MRCGSSFASENRLVPERLTGAANSHFRIYRQGTLRSARFPLPPRAKSSFLVRGGMSYQAKFNRILDKLYMRRTAKLRCLLVSQNGRPPGLTKKRREHKIEELQEIASNALAKKLAKAIFEKTIDEKRTWRTKGWGIHAKRKYFREWIRKRIHSHHGGKVYVFWRGHECRYVGRTRGGGARPSQHFRRGWFAGTTRIDVYLAPQKRSVPRLECLAMHHFLPSGNRMKAARQKWTPKCPLCRIQKKIRNEIREI